MPPQHRWLITLTNLISLKTPITLPAQLTILNPSNITSKVTYLGSFGTTPTNFKHATAPTSFLTSCTISSGIFRAAFCASEITIRATGTSPFCSLRFLGWVGLFGLFMFFGSLGLLGLFDLFDLFGLSG